MLSLAANDFNFSVLSLSPTVKLELSGSITVAYLSVTKWVFPETPVIVAMDPGPTDPVDDVDSVILTCRHREATIERMGPPDARKVPYLQRANRDNKSSPNCSGVPRGRATRAGFFGLIHVLFIQLDWHLITALVDGNTVTGNTGYDWPTVCNRLLGTVPPTNQLKGSRLNMIAFILQLLGGSIFVGKSSSMVQLMFLPLLEDFDVLGCIESYDMHLANVCMTFLVFSSLLKFRRGIDCPTLLCIIFLDNQ
ncbi:hypothetical protein CsSME_00024832 [Camellia sinensis var. sinensis]